MGSKRESRGASVVAPWWLGLGMLVSVTANAAQAPTRLESLSGRAAALSSGAQLAALTVGSAEDLLIPVDEIEPRLDLKPQVEAFPLPERAHKGDPSIGLRPSFNARLRAFPPSAAPVDSLLFDSQPQVVASGFSPMPSSAATWGSLWMGDAWATADNGADTELVLEDVTLAAYSPVANPEPETTVVGLAGAKPDFAALIEPSHVEREVQCLAQAVYFEARSEPETGQAAVAQVVLNRVGSKRYPSSICGVVYQNRNRRFACQFSFACEGRTLNVNDADAWRTAVRIAADVLHGKTFLPVVGAATHYHANYVSPRWARTMIRNDTIGAHIFYSLRPSQS